MVTTVPTGPDVGEKLVIVGGDVDEAAVAAGSAMASKVPTITAALEIARRAFFTS